MKTRLAEHYGGALAQQKLEDGLHETLGKTVVGTCHDGQFGLRDQSVHFDRFLDGDEGIAITDHDQRRCGDTRKICYCTDDQAACRAAMVIRPCATTNTITRVDNRWSSAFWMGSLMVM